jgi:superfamily I DNA and RNA helicase
MTTKLLIVRGTNDKPVASQALAQFFAAHDDYAGYLFIGYPIIGTAEGRHPIDAILVSPELGIVIFDLVEGPVAGAYGVRQDDSANKLEARLKTHRELMDRRALRIDIHTVTLAPGIKDTSKLDEAHYPLANLDTLHARLKQFDWQGADRGVYETALSAIQNISTIRKSRTKRMVQRPDSRGAKLKALEDSIATLDNLQSKAVLETVDGVQRLRGLAGSGKTIVLALKAAYFHAQHPDWRIAVTFNTRSLKGQFRRLINSFSIEQTGEEPNWDQLRIVNAWGASGGEDREGIYYEFCRTHGLQYFDFNSAQNTFGRGKEFLGACDRAVSQMTARKTLYDAVLVDEAQDFPPAFLKLCYEMLDDHKRLVYAYDELQNLGGESLPSPEEIFGTEPDGSPKVRFDAPAKDAPQRDIILEKCYRNSRPLLVTAHALGFGIYRDPPKNRDTGLVQMFDQPQLWEDIGYKVKDGELKPGSAVTLYRTDESSPRFLEEHSTISDLVQFIRFDSEEAQAEWLVGEVLKNLREDELRHDDIVVINTDPLTTRNKMGPIRRRLLDQGVSSHLAGVDTDPDIFFKPESASVTFTGIFRAKGNEAGMVYIVNAQDCHSSAFNLATIRNRLFTAITRSKAWVRVVGIGPAMERMSEEFGRLKARTFDLHFVYPTKEQREQLQIVHRDVTSVERRRVRDREKGLASLLSDLQAGKVHIEDIDEVLVDQLKALLSQKS